MMVIIEQFYSHFPNLATVNGSGTGTSFDSTVFTMECQARMVLARLVTPVLREEDVNSIVIKPEKEAEWSSSTSECPPSPVSFWFKTASTPSSDFIHDPRDFLKGTYGSIKEFESFSLFVVVFLFFAFLSMAFL